MILKNDKDSKKTAIFKYNFHIRKNVLSLHPISRSGAVVARWAHNPKVIGSNPVSATKLKRIVKRRFFFYSLIFINH